MNNILFIADTHLDTQTWLNRPRITGDSMASFRWLTAYARRHDVSDIVAAGDLIDVKKPQPEVADFVRHEMSMLEHDRIRFCFIQGQHEYARSIPWFSAVHDWPVWLDIRDSYSVGDSVQIQGFDWTPPDLLPGRLRAVDADTEVLVAHQVWEEFMGEIRGCEGSFSQIANAPVLFTGDYHDTKVYEALGASGQKLTVYSPGSTHLRKIDEPENKYCFLRSSDGAWSKVKIPTRRRQNVVLNDEDDLDELMDTWTTQLDELTRSAVELGLPEQLHRPLYWIKHKDDIPDVRLRVNKSIAKSAEVFFRTIPSESAEIVIERRQRQEQAAKGLVGCLQLVVPPDTDNYKSILRLLECADPAVELQKMKEERNL